MFLSIKTRVFLFFIFISESFQLDDLNSSATPSFLSYTKSSQKEIDRFKSTSRQNAFKIIPAIIRPTRTRPFITEFKLTSANLNRLSKNLELNYTIKSNTTYGLSKQVSTSDNSEQLIYLNLLINCSNTLQPAWYRFINGQLVTSIHMRQYTSLSFSGNEPIPGSLITCQAYAIDSDFRQNLSSSIHLVVEPPIAQISNLKRINMTALQLTWINPPLSSGIYHSLYAICSLSADDIRSERQCSQVFNKNNTEERKKINLPLSTTGGDKIAINGLEPGGNYQCTVITKVSYSYGLSASTESKNVNQLTELNKPDVKELNTYQLDSNDTLVLNITINNPGGCFYDHFSIVLIQPLPINQTIFKRMFFNNVSRASENTTSSFAFLTRVELGRRYQLWSNIERQVKLPAIRTELTQSKLTRLDFSLINENRSDNYISILNNEIWTRPAAPVYIDILRLSRSVLNVSWTCVFSALYLSESSFYYHITIKHVDNSNVTYLESETNEPYVIIRGADWLTHNEQYLIQVVLCISVQSKCDLVSLPRTIRFVYAYPLIEQLKVAYINNNTSSIDVSLSWLLNTSESVYQSTGMCDVGSFFMSLFSVIDKEEQFTQDTCRIPIVLLTSSNCNLRQSSRLSSNYTTWMKDNKHACRFIRNGKTNSSVICRSSETNKSYLNCSLVNVHNLRLNQLYSFSLELLSLNGLLLGKKYVLFKTPYTLPPLIQIEPLFEKVQDTSVSLNMNMNMNSNPILIPPALPLISFIQPDELDAPVHQTHILLIKATSMNRSIHDLTYINDAKQILVNSRLCSNINSINNSCNHLILKSYLKANKTDNNKVCVLIGNSNYIKELLDNIMTISNKSSHNTKCNQYEKIESFALDEGGFFHIVYVYEIKEEPNIHVTFLRKDRRNEVEYYTSRPLFVSQPILSINQYKNRLAAYHDQLRYDQEGYFYFFKLFSIFENPRRIPITTFIFICILLTLLLVSLVTGTVVLVYILRNKKQKRAIRSSPHKWSPENPHVDVGSGISAHLSSLLSKFNYTTRSSSNQATRNTKLKMDDLFFYNISNSSGENDDFFTAPSEFSSTEMNIVWLLKHANGDLLFEEEFRNLPDFGHIHACHASSAPLNEHKNRFLDIKAYDHSRVRLQPFMAIKDNPKASNEIREVSKKCSSDNNNKNSTNNVKTEESQHSVDKSLLSCTSENTSSLSTSSSNSSTIDLSNIPTLSHINPTSSISDKSSQANGYNIHIGCDQEDYINANYIRGYSQEKKYIATQGPKKETIQDFWQMVWQTRASCIVMLTKLIEKGVERCTQYWPAQLNVTESYGPYLDVTFREENIKPDYIKRVFDLTCTFNSSHTHTKNKNTPGHTSAICSTNRLTVTQYYYPQWPDKDIPDLDPSSILHLIRDVNLNHPAYKNPIVVHCSAGVGRTGTYITIDAQMEKITQEGTVDIFGFISQIRASRRYLVQTSRQYAFIYEALNEFITYGLTDIETSSLLTTDSDLRSKQIEIEFHRLQSQIPVNARATEAFAAENKCKNRDLNTVCYDENRVRLSVLDGSSYINASFINHSHTHLTNEIEYGIIITQDPMPNTLFEFYKMLIEHDCRILVNLNGFNFEKYEPDSVYWPSKEEPMRFCELDDVRFVVQLVQTFSSTDEDNKEHALFEIRVFELIEYKYSSTTKIKITQFVNKEQWVEGALPKRINSLLPLLTHVKTSILAEQQNLLNSSINTDLLRTNSFHVVVHAHGGGSNCSLFCGLLILQESLNSDTIDICRTIKRLRSQRMNMIDSLEHYRFLVDCLVYMLKTDPKLKKISLTNIAQAVLI